MYGSILFNCWGALIGFTIYFLLSLQNIFMSPFVILAGSFVTAIVVFLASFVVRMLLHFIFFTPEEIAYIAEEHMEASDSQQLVDELPSLDQSSSIEFQDENAEDIAKAVRTMMHTEQAATSA